MNMNLVLFSVSVVIIIELCIIIYFYRIFRQSSGQLKQTDRSLTNYVAQNLDLEKELADVKQELDNQKSNSEEIKQMRDQSRALKHDMKNHTLVMLSYLEEKQYEEAKNMPVIF